MFFEHVVRNVNGKTIYFKLAPTYALYLACRYRLSKLYRPEMGPTERAQRLSAFLNKMADIIDRTVEVKNFWECFWELWQQHFNNDWNYFSDK